MANVILMENNSNGDLERSGENYTNYHGFHDDPWFDEDTCLNPRAVKKDVGAKSSFTSEVLECTPQNVRLSPFPTDRSMSQANQDPKNGAGRNDDLSGNLMMELQQAIDSIEVDHKENLKPDLPNSPTEQNHQSVNSPSCEDETNVALPEVNEAQKSLRERLMESIKQVHKLPKQPSGILQPKQQSHLDSENIAISTLSKPLNKMLEQTSFGGVQKQPSIFDPDCGKIYCKDNVAVNNICTSNRAQNSSVNNSLTERQGYFECASEQKTNFDTIYFGKKFSQPSSTLAGTSRTKDVQSSPLKTPKINDAQVNFEFDSRQKSVFNPSMSESCIKVNLTNVGSASRVNSSTSLNNATNKVQENVVLLSKTKSDSDSNTSEDIMPRPINVAMAGSSASKVQHSPHEQTENNTTKTFQHELNQQSHFNQSNVKLSSGNNPFVASGVPGIKQSSPKKQKNKIKGSSHVHPKQPNLDPNNIDPLGQVIMAALATSTASYAQNLELREQTINMQHSARDQPKEHFERFNQFNNTFTGTNSASCKQGPLLTKHTNTMQDPARVLSNQSTCNPANSERFDQCSNPVAGSSRVSVLQSPALTQQSNNIQGNFPFPSQQRFDPGSATNIHEILSMAEISGIKKSPQKLAKKSRCSKCTDVAANKKTHSCKFLLRFKCPFCAFTGTTRQAVQYHRRAYHLGQRRRTKGTVNRKPDDSMPESGVLECIACSRKFGSLKTMKHHINHTCSKTQPQSAQNQQPLNQPATSSHPISQSSPIFTNPQILNQPENTKSHNFIKPQSPAKSMKPQSPTKGIKTQSPAKGKKPHSPAKGKKPQSPTKAKKPQSPAKDLRSCQFMNSCTYKTADPIALANHFLHCHPDQFFASHKQKSTSCNQPTQ